MADRGSGQLYECVAFDERAPVSDGEGNYEEDFVEQFVCRAGHSHGIRLGPTSTHTPNGRENPR